MFSPFFLSSAGYAVLAYTLAWLLNLPRESSRLGNFLPFMLIGGKFSFLFDTTAFTDALCAYGVKFFAAPGTFAWLFLALFVLFLLSSLVDYMGETPCSEFCFLINRFYAWFYYYYYCFCIPINPPVLACLGLVIFVVLCDWVVGVCWFFFDADALSRAYAAATWLEEVTPPTPTNCSAFSFRRITPPVFYELSSAA